MDFLLLPLKLAGWISLALAAGVTIVRLNRSLRHWFTFDYSKYPSLRGKTIIVTGGNTGLGLETARILAEKDAAVVLACRNPDTGAKAAKDIRAETGNNNVTFMHLNLASLNSVRNFTREVAERFPTVDCLVCNAGVWVPMEKGMKTMDGFEIHFGVNHLGHFLLTRLLMRSGLRRVVVVSSSLMSGGEISLDKEHFAYDGRKTPEGEVKKGFAPLGYCDSKLMNALFCKELARRLPNKIQAYAVCPGWCWTDLGRYVDKSGLWTLMVLPFMAMFMRSAWRGSLNVVWLVMEEKERLTNGGFYREGKLAEEEMRRLEGMGKEGEALWEMSERLAEVEVDEEN